MKCRKMILCILVGGILMLTLFGCGKVKYKVNYDGKDFYTNAKDSYRAGTKVTLYYNLIATDTDYTFYLDGEILSCQYDENKGFIITFTMPEHDVTLECRTVNSMEYRPE